jgi:stage II sporulation protein D
VTKRGASPRIMTAEIVGSRATTPTDGATLRAKFGLFDTWAYFTAISGEKAPADDSTPDSDPSGGAAIPPRSFSFRPPASVGVLRGTVVGPARGTRLRVQIRHGATWADVGDVRTGRAGAYAYRATATGTYRVLVDGAAGPAVAL